jgi:hypothetical protein
VDCDVLESLLDECCHLAALSFLKAEFAVLAEFTFKLHFLFDDTVLAGPLLACLQLNDLDVLGKDWDFDVIAWRCWFGAVVSDKIQLLHVLPLPDGFISAACLLSFRQLFAVSDQYFLLKLIAFLVRTVVMLSGGCLLFVTFIG